MEIGPARAAGERLLRSRGRIMSLAERLDIWLPQDVAERLREAAKTLSHLPMPRHGKPSVYRSTMPDPVISFWEMWNGLTAQERDERRNEYNRTRQTPSPEQIERMDEALDWLLWLEDPRNRRVVMAKAGGASFRKINFFDGRNREYLRQIWTQACNDIAKRLNHGT